MKKISELRRSKNMRLIILVVLIAILAVMWFVFEKFRIWIAGLIVLLLGATALEVSDTDFDVQKLIETGSFAESKVNVTENGVWLIDECKSKTNFNCDNFKYQDEAQDLFDACGGIENDIHGLDRNKNGIVCEANKKRPAAEPVRGLRAILGLGEKEETSTEAVEVAPAS